MVEASGFGSMPVSTLTSETVATIEEAATLYEVADAMAAAGVGSLLVGDRHAPTAIVTERDLVTELAARHDPGATTAGAVAHHPLVWCEADATVAEVAEMMMERYLRHVLVRGDGGGLLGVVSARDLLGVYAAGDWQDDGEG
jgi:CBS domain-containing protein